MENAADALKIVLGVVIFAIAFTTLFRTASLARYTSEYLITEKDETTYYSYYTDDEWPIKKDKNGIVNRVVTLEDMIPTIYRYSTESYGVTIIDNEKIVARFDMQTERVCSEWDRTTLTQKQTFVDQINNYVLKPIGLSEDKLIDRDRLDSNGKSPIELQELFEKIYRQQASMLHPRSFDCGWIGNDKMVSQRIDSDLSRNTSMF